MEGAAVAASTGGMYNKHFVTNFTDGVIKHYRVIKEPEIGVISVAELSVPQDIQSEFDTYYQLVTQWDPEPVVIGSANPYSQSVTNAAISSMEKTCSQGGGKSVYDYLSNSQARVELYNDSFENHPIIANAAASHLALSSILDGLGYKEFSISIPETWSSVPFTAPTGGTFRGVIEYMNRAVEIDKGSVLDCAGNAVPVDADGFFGNFSFDTSSGFDNFIDWAGLNSVPVENTCNAPGPVVCRENQNGINTCSVSCN